MGEAAHAAAVAQNFAVGNADPRFVRTKILTLEKLYRVCGNRRQTQRTRERQRTLDMMLHHTAAVARYRYPGTAIPDALRGTFEEMSKLDVELAGKAVELLKNTDLDLAREIQAQDEAVDLLHRRVFDTVLAPDWSENAMFTVDVTLASRYFERFADHVVDISAKVSFLQTGEW